MRIVRPNITILAFAVSGLALAALAAGNSYIVRPGDTLGEIARKNGVTILDLTRANDLKNPNDLGVGQRLVIPEPNGRGDRYTVAAGDTLGAIAQDHGISLKALAEANQISDPNALRPGQLLRIPKAGAAENAYSASPRYELTPELKKQLAAIKVTAGKWRYVVVHHSATTEGSARAMDLYHRQRRHMENGLAYHFVIGNGRGMPDGRIEIGNRWKRQIKGGHLASDRLNEMSIGICLVGNFDAETPSRQQLRSLYALVNYLEDRCHTAADAVKTHRQINTKPTRCPGRFFPTKALLENT